MQAEGSPGDAGGTAVRSALVDAADIVRRRYRLILACMIIGGAAATVTAFLAKKQYTAQSAVLFRDSAPAPTAAQALGGSNSSSSTSTGNPLVDQATDVTLVSLRTVDQLTATAVGNISYSEVRSDIGIAPSGSSNVVGITATTHDSQLSARLANAFADQLVAFRQQLDSAALVAAKDQARQLLGQLSPKELRGSTGRLLESQVRTLSLESSLQSGNVEVVERAVTPTGPSSPRKARDAVLGLLAGLLVGILVALGADRFDRRLRSVDEMASLLGRPVLGTVPRSRGFELAGPGPSAADLDAFHLLRTNVKHAKGAANTDAILVTSPQPSDGKSTVSNFLAMAAALPGVRVVLVDADLRRPGRYTQPIGLAQVLAGKADIHDVITTVSQSIAGSGEDIAFDVVPSGALQRNPVELLTGDRLAEVIAYCRANYDFTVVDSPPITLVSDAVLLTQVIPTVLVVARVGRTERMRFRRLVERLGLFNSNIIGLVANDVERDGGYGYGYGYAYELESHERGRRGEEYGPASGAGVVLDPPEPVAQPHD